jgi:hypothetical protein
MLLIAFSVQLKSQLQAGQSHAVVAKTVSKMEGLVAVSGAREAR